MQNTILDTEVTTIDGEVTSLQPYSGNVLLIVNVASKCGLTPQYEQLENLQKAWHQQGFSVLGFPCNQFLGQEPGSEEEIKTYCSTTWGVTFPMFSKLYMSTAEGRHPLYQKLIDAAPTAVAPADSGFVRANGEQRPCAALPGRYPVEFREVFSGSRWKSAATILTGYDA